VTKKEGAANKALKSLATLATVGAAVAACDQALSPEPPLKPVRARTANYDLPAVEVVAPWTYWYLDYGWSYWANFWDWDYDEYTTFDAGGGITEFDENLTPPPRCYPNTDSVCLTALLPRDSTYVQTVIDSYFNTLLFNDTTAQHRCEAMRNVFVAAYADGRVYRGAFNTGLPGDSAYHYGATDPADVTIHFDPWLLDSAATGNPRWIAQIANTALHEAAHILGKDHPSGGVTVGHWGMMYVDDWFKELNYSGQPGVNSCVSYPY
jgi:hypothetical protein